MKSLLALLVCASCISLVGCDHFAADGNLSRYYQPYSGVQTNWPTSSGGFVSNVGGYTIYHGFPPVPYKILGRFDRPNIPLYRVARCAHYEHADIVFLIEQNENVTVTDPSIIFFKRNFAVSTPTQTHQENRTIAFAYLAITNHVVANSGGRR